MSDSFSDIRHWPPGERNVWHPFTPNPHQGPKALLTRAEGAYVYDDKGRKYFDATSSWWCNIHGHCHPRLVDALSRQARQLDHVMFAPHSHPKALELASKLTETLGAPFSRVFYSDNGSTAVETALKMAAQYWFIKGRHEKKRFVSMERGYHGDTMGAVSLSGTSEFHGPFADLSFSTWQATSPYCFRCPLDLQYPSCQIKCLNEILSTIEKHGSEIAGLVVEPLVQGAGGWVMYPAAYLEKLVEACRRHDILVIFDEVLTGFGRTGTMFAFEQTKVIPDLICLAKGLTSGMFPLGATVTTESIFEVFDGGPSKTFYHGHTHTANALGCAVAVESLSIFSEDRVLARNVKLQEIMASQVAKFEALPHVAGARHLGMIWAMELVREKTEPYPVYEPANGPGWAIASEMWEAGYWIRPLGQVLYLIPPYCTTESELQSCFSVLYSAIESCKQLQT